MKKLKKALILPVALIVLLGLLAAVGGGDGDSGEVKKTGTVSDSFDMSDGSGVESELGTGGTESKSAEGEPETVQTVYHVGDILRDGDMKIVYVSSGEYTEENQYAQPDEGYQYIFLKFAFENTSEKNDESISLLSFDCYADGYACDMYYGGDSTLSATLSAGRTTTGCLYFSVPENAQEIEIEYKTNLFTSEKITFVYEGTLDSGYEPEKNSTASENALAVGATVEVGNLTITYLSCGVYESDNQFVQPRAGYHYIFCEFEVENSEDASSDEFVSYYDFDCYADGVSCDGCYLMNDLLSATISAGHKAKGTVAFEVPDNAKTIEVEYLANYWTSERIAFSYVE